MRKLARLQLRSINCDQTLSPAALPTVNSNVIAPGDVIMNGKKIEKLAN